MDHAPPRPAPAIVRVVVEPFVAECDHAARAGLIRRMDVALEVAGRAAPGVEIRVGGAIEQPRPRDPR